MKGILSWLILFLLAVSIYANPDNQLLVDSLLMELKTQTNDSLKIDILNDLSWELRNSEPELSVDYGLEAIEYAKRYNDYENLAKAHSFVGTAYRILGNYNAAIDYYYEGLNIANYHKQSEQEGYAYINIGSLHIYQGHYNNAIENLYNALNIANEIGNKRMLAYVNLNLGRSHMLKSDYSSALIYMNKALELRIELNNASGQAVCYKYIGDIFFEQEFYQSALMNYEKSLQTVDRDSDMDLFANIYIKIAEVYLQLEEFSKAKDYALKSLETARIIGARLIIRDVYKVLSVISTSTNHFKDAFQYQELVIEYNDTLFNQQLDEKIFTMEYQIEKQKKQAEIDLLNKEKEIKELKLYRNRIIVISLLIVLVLMGGTFIYVLYSYRYRQRQNELLQAQKEELRRINVTKDKMFLIIGHDLRGPIGNLKSLIDVLLEDEGFKCDNELIDVFNIFKDSVQSVYDLLENLLLWANSQEGEISMHPERLDVNALVEKNIRLFAGLAKTKDINIKTNYSKKFEAVSDKNMVLTVVRNLFSNALKYTPVGGLIEISMYEKDHFLHVEIKDNGVGFDEQTSEKIFNPEIYFRTPGTNKEHGSGLGLILCKDLVERGGGKIWAESKMSVGSTFTFTIPLEKS